MIRLPMILDHENGASVHTTKAALNFLFFFGVPTVMGHILMLSLAIATFV